MKLKQKDQTKEKLETTHHWTPDKQKQFEHKKQHQHNKNRIHKTADQSHQDDARIFTFAAACNLGFPPASSASAPMVSL